MLIATLDTLDALDLDATLSEMAISIGRLGDTSPLGVRRAHALGMLAHPQHTLDVFDTRADTSTVTDNGSNATRDPEKGWNAAQTTLYLHLTTDDLAAGSSGGTSGGRISKLGTATLDLLRDWLHRSDRVTLRPVLDLNRADSVDRHDPPDWMREIVVLRDGHCVFLGCPIDARSCDLDHIEAYLSPDDGGPPGQTSTTNLACLCRDTTG